MLHSFILLSAGRGKRFGNAIPKQYLALGGKPIIMHTLERIDKIESVGEIVIVCNNDDVKMIEEFLRQYRIHKKVIFTEGGETRQASVYNGLLAAHYDRILLHEAARPFVSIDDFIKILSAKEENITYFYPIAFTVLNKNDNQIIDGIYDREHLINVQLPQKYLKSDLMKCHEMAKQEGKRFTEDAGMMFYYLKKPVFCMQGQAHNIKITEYLDLLMGEVIYKEEFLGGEYN